MQQAVPVSVRTSRIAVQAELCDPLLFGTMLRAGGALAAVEAAAVVEAAAKERGMH